MDERVKLTRVLEIEQRKIMNVKAVKLEPYIW